MSDCHGWCLVCGRSCLPSIATNRDELLEALRQAVDHLDEECCDGFARNNSTQRQRLRALIRRVEGEATGVKP